MPTIRNLNQAFALYSPETVAIDLLQVAVAQIDEGWYQGDVTVQLADVARFHASAASLKAITPPLIPMQLHHAPEQMGDGDDMDFSMWMGPLPVRWVGRVEDVSPTSFLDRQVRGPFKAWAHCHTFVQVEEGITEVWDEVEARLKPHVLWGLVGLAMWLGLPLLFAYRGWKTRRLLDGDAA